MLDRTRQGCKEADLREESPRNIKKPYESVTAVLQNFKRNHDDGSSHEECFTSVNNTRLRVIKDGSSNLDGSELLH